MNQQIRITVALEQEREYLGPEEVASESFVLSDTLARSVDVRLVVGRTIADLIGHKAILRTPSPPEELDAETSTGVEV